MAESNDFMSDPVGNEPCIYRWTANVTGVNIIKLKSKDIPTIETLPGGSFLRLAAISLIREMNPNNTINSSMTGMLNKYINLISREKNDGANRGKNELPQNRKTLKNVIINVRRLCKIVFKF